MHTEKRLLSDLIESLPVLERIGSENLEITGLSYHTRTVREGHLFFACDGEHTDGHRFIEKAIHLGANVILHSKPVEEPKCDVTYIRLENPRFHMASVAAAYFGYPARELKVIGITGTNGKSTTAFYTEQLLTAAGYKTGLLSTTFMKTADSYEKNPFGASTPEAVEVHGVLRRIADEGNRYAVIEATSHALSVRNNRLGSVEFDAVVFTNLTHEHLEFHGGMEQYRFDKANLFRSLDTSTKTNTFGVVNGDSPEAEYFVGATEKPCLSYSVVKQADLYATDIDSGIQKAEFTIFGPALPDGGVKTSIAAPGAYNVENVLASLLTVSRLTRTPVDTWLSHLPSLSGVPGRMQRIDEGQPFALFVDFAHSPDAFSRVLPLVGEQTKGKLIIVFGSAGERDVEKRRIQGSIADTHADVIVLADEDPRGESPIGILEEIASACTNHVIGENLLLIPDRREAIGKALGLAKQDDTVLLLGKGHESSIEYADHVLEWDEAKTARVALKEMGYAETIDG